MSDSHLPVDPEDQGDGGRQPEVRLELTRAGVQEVLSLYSQEQRDGAADPSLSFGLADLEAAIRERRRMLGFGVLAGLVGALVVLLLSTPLYPVTAQVVIERHDVARAESAGGAATPAASFVATQAEIMQSESVIADALARLPDPGLDTALEADEVTRYESARLAEAVEAVRASPVSGTHVVALGYLGPDPDQGVALLTELVGAYRRVLARDEAALQGEKLEAKRAEIDVLDTEAERLEARLEALRGERGIVGNAEQSAEAHEEIVRDLAAQLADARNERITLENRLAAGEDQVAILDPSIRSLQEQLWAAEAELARVRLTLTARHPAVEAAEQEVTVLGRQLEASAKAAPLALQRDIEAARGLERQLAELHARERASLAALEKDRREESLLLSELERVRTLGEARRNELLDQRLVTRLAEAGEVGVSARLIEPPTLPESAAWPRPKLLIPLGLLVGGIGGLLAAIVSLRRERAAAEALEAEWGPPPEPLRPAANVR